MTGVGWMNRCQKERIDDMTINFMNLIENFSQNEDDLINIIDRANQYVQEPLHGILYGFVMDARLSADLEQAIQTLCQKLHGTKLEEVFWMLYICSMHDANYCEVIKDSKVTVKEYMKSKVIRKAIVNSARVDVIALLFAALFVIKILNDFLSSSVFSILLSGYIGIAIIGYCVLVVLGTVYYLFWR